MLTAERIRSKIKDGSIIITPFDESRLNPNSYNLRLDNKLLVYQNDILSMSEENKTIEISIPKSGIVLEPGKLYLGTTVEYTETHDCIPCIDGRSSIGRLGLDIHATAGFGDIGFCGKWTLEISCIQPIRILPYVEIGQIYYFEPDGEIEKTYKGKYQNQTDIIASRIHRDLT